MIANFHPATSRQVEYIIALAKHHGTALPSDEQIADWTQFKASEIIDWYLSKFGPLPRRQAEAPVLQAEREVKAGHYAIEFDGQLRFFKVDTPDEGRWAGWTFVKEQASDDYWSVKGQRKVDVLNAIADDEDSLARYGRELGVCGMCNRTLTDPESREIGLGPICRNK